MSIRIKALGAALTVCLGIASTVLLAGPASAADSPTPDATQSAALQQWLDTKSTTLSDPTAAQTNLITPDTVSSSKTSSGARLTVKYGTPLLWTSNTLEWYYTASKITSSSGSQADGYIFPNTASKGGIKRTLVSNTQHNWRGTMNVGLGSVTPWGDVDLYHSSRTDYFELFRKGVDKISE